MYQGVSRVPRCHRVPRDQSCTKVSSCTKGYCLPRGSSYAKGSLCTKETIRKRSGTKGHETKGAIHDPKQFPCFSALFPM